MQVHNEYEFGSSELRCWVITRTYMIEGEGEEQTKTEIKSPLFQEVPDDMDITNYPEWIQSQITAWRLSE